MQRLCTKVLATFLLLGTSAVVTTAKADMNYGPVKNGDQCFTKSGNGSESMWGWWGPCPQPAAAAVERHPTAQHEHHAKRR